MTAPIRPIPSPLLTSVVLVTGLLIGTGLGIAAYGPNVFEFDVDVTLAIQRMQGSVLESVANVANALGSTLGAGILISIALIIAAIARAWSDLFFLASLLVLRLLATQLKPIFDSPRPTNGAVTILGSFDGTGYPSGHALTAAAMALGLAVIAWRRLPSRPLAIGTMVGLVLLALVVGWARIWTGAHWASDVVGGYAFGVAIVAVSLLLLRRFMRTKYSDSPLTAASSDQGN